jgi:putative acetyltransferase
VEVFVRPESPRDHAAIRDVTKRAFAPMPFAGGDEQDLIEKLREAGALAISLVAERDGIIVGHIAFSPAFAADASRGWFALGPVAVEPGLQRQGVGKKLIGAGVKVLRELDAAGCVLIGNPNYYSRFGFKQFPHLAPDGEPAEFFMILPLRVVDPQIVVGFHPLFKG